MQSLTVRLFLYCRAQKGMVNVRGLNVYPREIEEVLYQNPKVKEFGDRHSNEHKGEVPKVLSF